MGATSRKTHIFRIVVAGVIVKGQSALLLQRRKDEGVFSGMWELPSGKREFNETCVEALIREIKEETGLSIVAKQTVSVFEYIVESPVEIRDTTQINFLVCPGSSKQKVRFNKEEHQAARWFTRDQLLSLQNISDETRECILMALSSQNILK